VGHRSSQAVIHFLFSSFLRAGIYQGCCHRALCPPSPVHQGICKCCCYTFPDKKCLNDSKTWSPMKLATFVSVFIFFVRDIPAWCRPSPSCTPSYSPSTTPSIPIRRCLSQMGHMKHFSQVTFSLNLSFFFAVFQCGSWSSFLPQYWSRSGSGSKPMRIYLYPDPGQTLPPEKVGF